MELKTFLENHADEGLINAVERALECAEGPPSRPVHLADLMLALFEDVAVQSRVSDARRESAAAALKQVIESAASGPTGGFAFDLAVAAEPSIAAARDWGATRVSPLFLLAACLADAPFKEPDSVRAQEALRRSGLTLADLATPNRMRTDFTYQALGFGTDLTAMAQVGVWPTCPLIGLDRELRRLVSLLGAGADSAVVVGEPGVGKSALVYGLAYHLARGTQPLVPSDMAGWTVVMISPSNLLAGTWARGELEKRLDDALTFFKKNPTVVPFFDEIHTLLDTGDPIARGVATALKPSMALGSFRCIGATTDKEYARYIAADEALNSRFTKILVPEPDHPTATRIITDSLANVLPGSLRDRGVTVAPSAVQTAVRLSATFQRNDRLPRKAIRLLRMAATDLSHARRAVGDSGPIQVDSPHIAATLADLTGIPVNELDDDPTARLDKLRQQLASRVVGQDSVLDGVVGWLRVQASGWVDPRRPRGRFVFLGPPGVGKTELANALAEQFMRDRGSVVIKNMAEYRGDGASTRWMGADPGYTGFGQTPTIYSQVLMRPYSVVVLDEFEKADPVLANPLLSVLDGYAEDSQGRWVDFSQCLFVLTSNSFADITGTDAHERAIREALRRQGGIWTSPLVDRLDRFLVFRSLDTASLSSILNIQIARRKADASRPLPAEIDDAAVRAKIVSAAHAAEPGGSARGLERALLDWLITHADAGPTAC